MKNYEKTAKIFREEEYFEGVYDKIYTKLKKKCDKEKSFEIFALRIRIVWERSVSSKKFFFIFWVKNWKWSDFFVTSGLDIGNFLWG